LAKKVLEACEQVLPGPKAVMDYICAIADHCAEQDRFLKWTSPSGFPVENRYQEANIKTIKFKRRTKRGKTSYTEFRVEHDIADGVTDEIDDDKVHYAAAPNLIHSLDASHLIKVVNASVSEDIADILTVHDCFACLAPQAERFLEIILAEMADLYKNNDPLGDLRDQNLTDPHILPVPLLASWEEDSDGNAQVLPFLLEKVKRKRGNGFG
jgi:DNA-directed RNA polymerase